MRMIGLAVAVLLVSLSPSARADQFGSVACPTGNCPYVAPTPFPVAPYQAPPPAYYTGSFRYTEHHAYSYEAPCPPKARHCRPAGVLRRGHGCHRRKC